MARMEPQAPAVVAVVVTRDPGSWFDEVLASWAAVQYDELAVLVLDAGAEDPTDRVAAAVPGAFVRRLPGGRGFGPTANEVLSMVEGAAFFLLCHDDCAPTPDAVHRMVEESFRSNAGVVTPKMVRWDDPEVLLHVGMGADKAGAVYERVGVGEVDHGQHDAVRDVFVAPGGCTLIRADLFAELGGFDATITAMGEDLDLSWRAQVAGARVVVAPSATVRHLEALAAGLRPPPPDRAPSDGDGGAIGAPETTAAPDAPTAPPAPPTLQALRRRHELWTVLKCYSAPHLVRVLPQMALLALGELIVGLFAGERQRATAVLAAWRWNWVHRAERRGLRHQVQASRAVSDSALRRLQGRGSARLRSYAARLVYEGFDTVHQRPGGPSLTAEAEPELTGSVGLAFSEDADFDELDDLGHRRSGRDRFGRRRHRGFLSSRRSRLAAYIVAAVILVFGTRELFAAPLPMIGQLLPPSNWSSTWAHFLAGWQPAGVGTTAPATPAYGVLGLGGTVLLGAMGQLQKVLLLGCVPLGAWGMLRLLRPLASSRGRLAAGLAYLGLPLAYDALARGRLDGLVAYALVPWMLARLVRASRLAPVDGSPERAAPGRLGPGWGRLGAIAWHPVVVDVVVLGALEALAMAFAPAVAPVLLLSAIGFVAGSFVVGEGLASLRVLAIAGATTVVAAVLCAPWVIGTLAAGHRAVGIFGLGSSAQIAPSWGGIVRFAVGPVGSSPLTWLLVAAALLPLLIGRGPRLAWAARFWAVACLGWLVALASARGWMGSFAPSLDVALVPAAVGVAASVGLGIAAFDEDLHGFHFGWRQTTTAFAVVAAVIGLIPVVAESFDGRWSLPGSGYAQTLAFVPSTAAEQGFRVLWLGDPAVMPVGGWSIEPGLADATSEGPSPDTTWQWAPAGPGPAAQLGQAVQLAESGSTSQLGRLLAPAGIRYIVVVENLAPTLGGSAMAAAAPTPPLLLPALMGQDDLLPVPGAQGYAVFENTEALPVRAGRAAGPVLAGPTSSAGAAGPVVPAPADLAGWKPVLAGSAGGASFSGVLPKGTVLAAEAPAGRWQLQVAGHGVPGTPAWGWAVQYRGVPAGRATLAVQQPALNALGAAVMIVLWVALGVLFVGRHRRRAGPRRRRPGRPSLPIEPLDDPGQPVGAPAGRGVGP